MSLGVLVEEPVDLAGLPRVIPGVQASTSRDFPLQWAADGRSIYVQATTDTEREAVIDLVDVRTGA